MSLNTDLGVLIKNSGGLRKVRWSVDGRGKRGGVRIIYYWMTENEQLYMMYIFPKNTQENLTDAQTKALRQIVERWLL
ncbi:type II toxin-antitoxin system RelE/ParE family toxin [Marinomonas primoryensis]|uniref:type II toxin-antitoxin system RelE/ParE family toxin n=1 Tax=Marinomonas primoryensis TaxID=178399 RepID=UPI00370457F6